MNSSKRTTRRPKDPGRGPDQYLQPEPSDDGAGDSAPAAEEVARYIADMTVQLASMAIGAKLELLAYFLKMAHAESAAHSRPAPGPGASND
jgi:hypothetical protein